MPISTKFAGLTALLLSFALPLHAEDMTAAKVMATVNGQEITLGQMVALRGSLPAEYQNLPDDVLFNGILDQLIQQTALAQIGEKAVSAKDEARMEVDRRAYLAGAVLDKTASQAVTEDGLKAEYDAKYAGAEPSREYHAAHILLKTEDEAKAVKAAIDGGADFTEQAKMKSTGPSGPNGGDLGWFELSVMVKPFADALADMKPGDVSGPVQTEFGWHVIKLFDTRLAEAPKLEDVRAELEGDLRSKAVEAQVTEVVSKSEVVRNTDGVDPAVLKNTAIFGE
ncbi:peptidylprolyl isomerase [Phaeovulum sp. W22_SRMD_FR3]|uniref:peptidylprolyl isomerase n=1 Tax=Phaeovulum sp. W22_SRMD_FR3 TaxID=3240274 RepID=UPI003F97A3E7